MFLKMTNEGRCHLGLYLANFYIFYLKLFRKQLKFLAQNIALNIFLMSMIKWQFDNDSNYFDF